jgi:hypothetical protein
VLRLDVTYVVVLPLDIITILLLPLDAFYWSLKEGRRALTEFMNENPVRNMIGSTIDYCNLFIFMLSRQQQYVRVFAGTACFL